jgi:hypothetical protein
MWTNGHSDTHIIPLLSVYWRSWQDSRTCGFRIIVNNAEGDPQLIILGTHDVDVMDIEGFRYTIESET